ncbi:MAG: 3'-5' exoribonuclease YhaM family protein [Desulfomonile sp.]|nr:3'-5' exoribonuclease YhaM family protein [Desulfomonile sp.]
MSTETSLFPHTSVKELKPGDTVLDFFQLRSLEVRRTRAGDNYLDMALGDATGTISAKMWPDAIRKWGREFAAGDFVKIEGKVESYRDKAQLIVEKIRAVSTDEVPDVGRLVRVSAQNPAALCDELGATAAALRPPDLAHFVCTMLDRNSEALKTFPAARMVHHAYVGGLIEHTASVVRKVAAVAELEKAINRDLALAGAILHDIGKLRELNPSAMGRTIEGRLIGHLILGVEMLVALAIEQGVVDRPWFRELEHIVVSHHGEVEFGSPMRPMSAEAILVHFIDNLDSRLKIVEEALQAAEPDGFSAYNKWLGGRAFAGFGASGEETEND